MTDEPKITVEDCQQEDHGMRITCKCDEVLLDIQWEKGTIVDFNLCKGGRLLVHCPKCNKDRQWMWRKDGERETKKGEASSD